VKSPISLRNLATSTSKARFEVLFFDGGAGRPMNLYRHMQKLKVDILRVQNAHTEIALVAEELKKDVDRLRGYVQKIQVVLSSQKESEISTILRIFDNAGVGAAGI
jgi:type IV secretory pathway component VirB8